MATEEEKTAEILQIEELEEIQDTLDEEYIKYLKQDYDVKYEHFKNLKPTLERREKIVSNLGEEKASLLIDTAISKLDGMQDLLPINENKEYDYIVKMVTVEYTGEGKATVRLNLKPNNYIANEYLERQINFFENAPTPARIEWKDESGRCPLFNFFEDYDDDLEIFDIIYEFYVNYIYYAKFDN
ncbi:hypothetical protein ENBRE01_1081 [Enteropsectra breve]|nr:hypothetical protein ENBRE01_1081 [Enteropsectra breve]